MYYGDKTRWFIGTAIEINKDFPGKIKVRIFGIHGPDIDNANLPWADILIPTTEAGTSGIGKIPQIHPPARVYGFFLDGENSQSPIVLGSMFTTERESATQQRLRTTVNRGSTSSSVDASSTIKHDGFIQPNNLIKNYNTVERAAGGYGSSAMVKKSVIIMSYLTQNGYTPLQAAGIVGNLTKESFNAKDNVYFDPTALGDNGNSYGLAQWNNSANAGFRWNKLKNYANLRNLPESDFFGQLGYLVNTLNGSLGGKDTDASEYSYVHRRLINSNRINGPKGDNNATWVFLDRYENPANKDSEYITRSKYATDALSWYEASINGV